MDSRAEILHRVLGQLPHFQPSEKLTKLIAHEAQRLPHELIDDLATLVFIDCLEEMRTLGESTADDDVVGRAIWRNRKRLTRQLAAERQRQSQSPQNAGGMADTTQQPDRIVMSREGVARLLAPLDAEDVVVLQWLADGATQRQIAADLGWSEAKVSRRLAKIRTLLS